MDTMRHVVFVSIKDVLHSVVKLCRLFWIQLTVRAPMQVEPSPPTLVRPFWGQ